MKKIITKLNQNDFLSFFWSHYQSSDIDLSSIAVAYYLLLTTFPFLMLLANIFPYLNLDISALLLLLKDSLPDQLYGSVSEVVRTIFNERSDGLLGLAILTGLWTVSRGLTFLQKAMNKAYDVDENRDFLVGRFVSLVTGFLLVSLVSLAVFIGTFGHVALDVFYRYFPFESDFYNSLRGLIRPTMLLIFTIAIGLLYYLMPNVRIVKWRYLLPGTLLTTVVTLVLTTLSGNYLALALKSVENFRFIGSVATFTVMFCFIFFSKLIIVGAMLNAAYQKTCENELSPRRGSVSAFFEK